MAISYIGGGEEITTERMQALWAAFDAKLATLLNGRSPMLILPSASYPKLYGQVFFFTSGPSVYANDQTGYSGSTVTIPDPVVGGTVDVPAATTYDHAAYTALAAGLTPLTFDTSTGIVEVAAVPAGSYPAGHAPLNGQGVFERSLEAHTLTATAPGDTEARAWFIKEQGTFAPTKRWNYAVAEIVIEGPEAVNLPASYDAFGAYRFHNLQARSCVVTVGDVTLTLEPFECRTMKRDKTTRAMALCALRYFFDYADHDFRMFWYHGSLQTSLYGGQHTRTDVAVNKAISMQANNLTNAALLYDWISHLTSRNLKAYFVRDPHELCDIYALLEPYRQLYGDPSNPETLVGDLIHHKGTIKIVRMHKTLKEPDNPAVPLTTYDSVEFRGYATIVQDFAAKLLTVTENSNGNLEITNADPDNHVDLIGVGTNLLKHTEDTGGGGWSHWQLPTAVSLEPGYENAQTPYELEHQIMEGGNPHQDVDGATFPEAGAIHSYRLSRKAALTPQPSPFKVYEQRDPSLEIASENLPDHQTGVTETYATLVPRSVAGIHKLKVADLLSLAYNGDGTLPSQDDGLSTYVDKRLTLTPEGLVMTFTERLNVRIEAIEADTIKNWAGRGYTYDEALGVFTMKHAVRLRRHGFGWGQHGKNWAAFWPPYDGRGISNRYLNETQAASGGDFDIPFESISETAVKAISLVPYQRLGTEQAGYLLTLGQAPNTFADTYCNPDGLVAFMRKGTDPEWYFQNRHKLTSRDGQTASLNGSANRYILAMPMAAEHFNGFAQAVNQLTAGKALSVGVYRERFGAQVMTFDSDEFTGTPSARWIKYPAADVPANAVPSGIYGSGRRQVVPFGSNAAKTVPLPMNLWCVLASPPGDTGGMALYWQAFLASKGVTYLDDSDMPITGAQRLFRPVQTSLRLNSQLAVAGATATVSARFRGGTSSAWQVVDGAWDISATVTGTMTPEFTADVETGTAGEVSGEITPGANMNDYAGVRWYSIEQARTLFGSLGLPFAFVQPCVQLRLTEMEWQTELEVLEHSSTIYAGRIIEGATWRLASNTAPQTPTQAQERLTEILAQIEGKTYTEQATLATDLVRKRQVFAVCTEEEKADALWKWPLLQPESFPPLGENPYSYHVVNRTEGDAVTYYGTGLANGWQSHVGFRFYLSTPDNAPRITLRTWPTLPGAMAGAVPPWTPGTAERAQADDLWVVLNIAGSGDPSGGIGTSNQWRGRIGFDGIGAPVEGTAFSNSNMQMRVFTHSAGKWRARLATPTDAAEKARQDLWFRVANREAQWSAVLFYGSEESPVTLNVAFIETAVGFVTFRREITPVIWDNGGPRKPREPGAFRDYPDGFFVMLRGTPPINSVVNGYTGLGADTDALLPFQVTAPDEPDDDLPRAPEVNALTVLQPYRGESFRVFLDIQEPLTQMP